MVKRKKDHILSASGDVVRGELEVGNVTDSSQILENKARLFFTELLPKKCVHSNAHKKLRCLCLGHKMYIYGKESGLTSPRILIPVDVIKMNENNNSK